MTFNEKVIMVTGAAWGIGRDTACSFHEKGGRTVLVDIDVDALESVRARVDSDRIMILGADVTKSEDVDNVVKSVVEKWGGIDVLVNNAGGAIGDGSLEGPESDWSATFALCFTSQFLFSRAVAPVMRQQSYGRIINISSNAGIYRSNTGVSSIAYSAAKAASLQLTRSTAHALGRFGITVNAIAPGSVFSEAGVREYEGLSDEVRDQVMAETPLGYFAETQEIASVAMFLASDAASYVTGATIVPNGGWCTS